MSAKNRDNKNRWRNITVGFRVSPEENELSIKAGALSGLPRQTTYMKVISSQKKRNGLRTKPLPKKLKNCLPIRLTVM